MEKHQQNIALMGNIFESKKVIFKNYKKIMWKYYLITYSLNLLIIFLVLLKSQIYFNIFPFALGSIKFWFNALT